ncbi:MAG: 50S ribosomal protein L24 [Candidatus Pelagibacterales bacterium]|jgi:large subunit ribosomal protein L24|tara:strand:- start:351 stop:662 length:312 start_codon:yes stop_codon:yes gene_type:complete
MVARIKKGDTVFVNCGKDIGKTGEVLKMLGTSAVVKGINVAKKHKKQDQKNEGGIINKEMPIKLDNLMLIDKKSNKPTRVRTKILNDKKKVRISVLSGDQIDA